MLSFIISNMYLPLKSRKIYLFHSYNYFRFGPGLALFLMSLNASAVGRAGRYGSKFPIGEVTCLDAEDLPLLQSSLNSPSPALEVSFKAPDIKYLTMTINKKLVIDLNFNLCLANFILNLLFLICVMICTPMFLCSVLGYFLRLISCIYIHDYTPKRVSHRYW